MKNVSFVLWKKLNGLFSQPDINVGLKLTFRNKSRKFDHFLHLDAQFMRDFLELCLENRWSENQGGGCRLRYYQINPGEKQWWLGPE